MNILSSLLAGPDSMVMIYKLFGKGQLTNALVGVFGTRTKLAQIANKNKDDVQELIDKRDAAISALLEYIEEIANADED